jgi:hypothetical protein
MLIRIRSDQTGDDKRFIADDLFVTHPMRQCNVHVAQLRYQQCVHGANKRIVFVVRKYARKENLLRKTLRQFSFI